MNKLYVFLVVAAVTVSYVAASEISNTKCSGRRESNTLSTVTEIDVDPCEGANGEVASPCVLTRGPNSFANITVRFIPSQKHRRMKASIVWASGSVDLPFRGLSPNACSSLTQGSCPTTPNEPVLYKAQIPLKPSFPASTFPLKLKIMDGTKYVVCQAFYIKLV